MIQFAQIDKLPPTDIGDNRCSSAYPFLSFKYKRVIPMHRTRISIRNEAIIYINIDNPSSPIILPLMKWFMLQLHHESVMIVLSTPNIYIQITIFS